MQVTRPMQTSSGTIAQIRGQGGTGTGGQHSPGQFGTTMGPGGQSGLRASQSVEMHPRSQGVGHSMVLQTEYQQMPTTQQDAALQGSET